ncbi:hypothetical protein SLI_0866 [Streptomyces lividans 1326]|uniref:Uncharacterized protein n=1 Tax=Streptomyces lividans 1326 TaxID=1200984 RepID=A0A7U9DM01_STRLI|nr:hypothetical protein SLI_0866 [Streptomyces lividans 1326]
MCRIRYVLELDRTVAGGDRTGAAGLDGGLPVRRGEGVRRGATACPGAAGGAVETAREDALTCGDASILLTAAV